MSERIKEIKEIEGKIIKAVVGYDDEYLIAFSDESFITIGIARGYEDSVDITFTNPHYNDYNLVEAGLLTEEEYEAARAEKQELRRRQTEEADFRIYRMLKARFEQ